MSTCNHENNPFRHIKYLLSQILLYIQLSVLHIQRKTFTTQVWKTDCHICDTSLSVQLYQTTLNGYICRPFFVSHNNSTLAESCWSLPLSYIGSRHAPDSWVGCHTGSVPQTPCYPSASGSRSAPAVGSC